MTPETEVDEVGDVGLGPGDDLEVVRLVLLGDADLEEAVELRAVLAAARRRLDEALDVGEAEDRREARAGHPPVRALALPVGEPEGLEPGDRLRASRRVQPGERQRIDAASSGGSRSRRRGPPTTARAAASTGGPEQDALLAVAHEPGLHQQLDVAVGVGAGDVEAGGGALRALAQELLDEPVADLAGVGHPDGIELDDRPLVADRLALDADEPGDPALLLVDEHQVVRPERAERQAEQAEHADRRAVDRQAERARVRPVRLAQPRQLAERGEVGQARGADLAACCAARGARSSGGPVVAGRQRAARRMRPAPGALARDRRARRPSSRPGDGSGSRRQAPDGTPSR